MDTERNDRLRGSRTSHTAERGMIFCKVAVFVMFLAGCDFEVTNPGPVDDAFLNSPDAADAVVTGVERALTESQNKVGFQNIVIAREEAAAGNPGNFGHRRGHQGWLAACGGSPRRMGHGPPREMDGRGRA